jgi:hypothetical protein
MNYLALPALDAVSDISFRDRKPYPWAELPGLLTAEGYRRLRATLPEAERFDRMVGVKRAHGQKSHDRYILHYLPGLDVPAPWQGFIAELQGEVYQSFLRRMLGLERTARPILTLEWYYAWGGCSVSPHCDARRKIATHIFFFNDETDWQADWGGEILILDDAGRFKPHSAPTFDDLRASATIDARGNASLLFQRTEHSWHGVRPLRSPPDQLRKLFIITVNAPTWQVRWRRIRGKDPDGFPLRRTA